MNLQYLQGNSEFADRWHALHGEGRNPRQDTHLSVDRASIKPVGSGAFLCKQEQGMNLPNKLTIGRVIAVPFFIAAYMTGLFFLAFILFILASLTDMLDGKIARKRGLVTNFGKIMDPLADKILVYAAFCLLMEDGRIAAWMLIVILAREFAVAGMRTVAASEGIVIAAAWSGKFKTVLQMIAVPLLLLSVAWKGAGAHMVFVAADVFLWASLVMTVYSGAEYIARNKTVFAS